MKRAGDSIGYTNSDEKFIKNGNLKKNKKNGKLIYHD